MENYNNIGNIYNFISSTNPLFLISRLVDLYIRMDRIVIAYDIDDTVRPYYCTHCNDIIDLIKKAKDLINPYYIVYTSNPETEEVIQFLTENDIPFDAVNKNPPFFVKGNPGDKIYYNVFLDDKCGISETKQAIEALLELVENGLITK